MFEVFDLIAAGGGSTGAVIASRLSPLLLKKRGYHLDHGAVSSYKT